MESRRVARGGEHAEKPGRARSSRNGERMGWGAPGEQPRVRGWTSRGGPPCRDRGPSSLHSSFMSALTGDILGGEWRIVRPAFGDEPGSEYRVEPVEGG